MDLVVDIGVIVPVGVEARKSVWGKVLNSGAVKKLINRMIESIVSNGHVVRMGYPGVRSIVTIPDTM